MATAATLLVALSGLGTATAGAHLVAAQSGGGGPGSGVIVSDGIAVEVAQMEIDAVVADAPVELALADAPVVLALEDSPIEIEVTE